MASGKPLSPSLTVMQTSSAVLDLRQHRKPEFRSFAAVPGPEPEDVAFAVHADTDGDVDRPVRDLPVADFDVDRVDEHHRVDTAPGPGAGSATRSSTR